MKRITQPLVGLRAVIIITASGFLLTCVFALYVCVRSYMWVSQFQAERETVRQQRQANWERYMASPIDEEVVEDFCNRELVPTHIADCEDPNVVIPYSAVPDIFEENVDINNDTYEDVTTVFGQYEHHCGMQLDCSDGDRYRCSYRFHTYSAFVFFDCVTHRIVDVHWATPGDS